MNSPLYSVDNTRNITTNVMFQDTKRLVWVRRPLFMSFVPVSASISFPLVLFWLFCLGAGLLSSVGGMEPEYEPSGFVELLNGKNLDGWKAAENPEAFSVDDGLLKINGKRGYLYYDGDVNQHSWKDFHAQIAVQTKSRSASGIFFHTNYEKEGVPRKGYECQIANSNPDPQKTGSLYNVSSENSQLVEDNDWFIIDIYVRDRRVVTMVNGRWSVNWLEPKDYEPPKGFERRRLDKGTFAIESQDPNSTVLIKSFRVRPLK